MNTNKETKKELHFGVKIASAMYGIVLYLYAPVLIGKFSGNALDKNISTTISLIIAGILCFWFLPKVIGIPKKGAISDNLKTIGFKLPKKWGMNIFLGVLLAICTLTGMLIGSLLTGLYEFNINTISIEHIYFSFLPGIFEEIIFRGFVIFIFLDLYKNLKKAVLIQCIIFVILHIGSFEIDIIKIIDLLGVFALALTFTYVVYKTRSLLSAMIFHILHDAFLFVVQPPKEIVFNLTQAIIFYSSLFAFAGIAILLTKFFARKLHVQEDNNLYLLPSKELHYSQN